SEISRMLLEYAACGGHSPKSILIRQGERCDDVILVLVGKARAVMVTADGRAFRLGDYIVGDLFGAIEGVKGQRAEVAVVETMETARFQAMAFFDLAERFNCVALTLSRSLLRQVSHLSDLLGARVSLSAAGRVYAELSRLAVDEEGRIIPAPTVTELALRAQTTRETASRAMSALERRRIVERSGTSLVIASRRRLEELIV
ncbi:MAG TPA: Crp/Fnr family transcriptional regulator, partial [Novosphingobium sp.]|nr:Crp/Fnr family transcriptional regulator [Novosphingobium sp.]